jgi:hypothetical protein
MEDRIQNQIWLLRVPRHTIWIGEYTGHVSNHDPTHP